MSRATHHGRSLKRCRSSLHPRSGRLNLLWVLLLGAAGISAAMIGLLSSGGPGEEPPSKKLTLYCAAGLRVPVEKIAANYKDEFGITVELQFDGSNTLLNRMQVNKFDTADLYLAADDYYTTQAVERGLAAEVMPIAHMRPVVAVRKDNPKGIASFDDLLQAGVRISFADPEQAAIGKDIRGQLQKIPAGDATRWDQLEKQVTASGVFKPTVTDVANDLLIGAVDVAFVWDSTVAMPKYHSELTIVEVAEFSGDPNLVSVAVLNSSRQPTAALRFARYLTARDRGLPVFKANGLLPVEGDEWSEKPNVTFFCGAVNRRAVEEIIERFQQREGCVVNTVYDGCGTLTSRMHTITDQQTSLGFPDVYMACDVYYLDNVRQWFQEAANVSSTEMVIAVPKGSDRVKSVRDLAKPGVRIAIGEPDHCTIGALTRRMLVAENLYDEIKAKQKQENEVVLETTSSALLVPQVLTGHVDAAVAYITDTLASQDKIDIVRLPSPLNTAIQPLSISRSSQHKYLIRRLYRQITTSPEAFKKAGFDFRYAAENKPGEASPNKPPVQ